MEPFWSPGRNRAQSTRVKILAECWYQDRRRSIAQEMLVSLSSVKVCVRHIIDKLGVSDRTQAAGWAVELGLLPEQQQ
jgi:DNA-binding CsgD family transcriptional regulator